MVEQVFSESVTQMIHLDTKATLSQAKENLKKVQKMATQAFNIKLREIARSQKKLP